MEIRPLTREDAPAFFALRLRGFEESPGAFGTAPEEWRDRPLSEVEQMIREDPATGNVTLGAFAPGLVGHVGLLRQPRRKRAHKATVFGLYVAPEARGRGVARDLLEELLRRARAVPGLVVVELTVIKNNETALGLYERLGFRSFGMQPRALRLGDAFFDEAHLFLDLDRA